MRACKRAMGEGQAPAPHILPISQLPDYRWRRQAAPSSRFSFVAEHLACNEKVAGWQLASRWPARWLALWVSSVCFSVVVAWPVR